jgi:hypothetical protein
MVKIIFPNPKEYRLTNKAAEGPNSCLELLDKNHRLETSRPYKFIHEAEKCMFHA